VNTVRYILVYIIVSEHNDRRPIRLVVAEPMMGKWKLARCHLAFAEAKN
jgi:hypothetical protein